MSGQKNSAEIFEIGDARARLRQTELDPRNFPAVGQYLEAVREQLGLSLAAVSERTHIKASYLEAIEKMAIDRLPNRAFAVGFAKVYAEALGLKADPVIERFKAETGLSAVRKAAEPAAAAPAHGHAPTPGAAPAREPARLSFIAVLAIIAFMVWCAYWITRPRDPATPLNLSGVPLAATEIEEARAVTDPEISLAPAAEPEAAASEVGPLDAEAQVIERVEPVYPPVCEAGAAPVETVEVAFTITPDGAVVSERVANASNSCFERAALNAIKRWRFTPKMKEGVARPAFEQRAEFRFDRPS